MRRMAADLREIAEAVALHPGDGFSVRGERVRAGAGVDRDVVASQLAQVLYQRLYCRPETGGPAYRPDGRAARVFLEALSQANIGCGTWEAGWLVQAVEGDGTLMVHRASDDLTLWAQPGQFRPLNGSLSPGSAGRLRLGKELREMLPGYYTILGEADQDGDDAQPSTIVRFYWHLTAEAGCLWVRELTRRFNDAAIAFHAKLLADPGGYMRADAGVMYVPHVHLPAAMALMPDLHLAVSELLRPATPMFTRRLARGLALAMDPGGGQSFGQHRCRLVAEGLIRALDGGLTESADAASAIAQRFGEEGLDIARPWLGPGSRESFAWPARRPTMRQMKKRTGT